MIKIGSHVGMSGKEMMLGSAKEAVSYNANTFMLYTGAPQNTRRKDISELNIEPAWDYMEEHGIEEMIVHAPYIINLGNTVKPETYEIAESFLRLEIERTEAMKGSCLVLHPGAHVGAGTGVGLQQIINGLNKVLTKDTDTVIALETMAGKGSELGKSFEELATIFHGVTYNNKLRICFDTCHVNDSGYDLVNDLDGVLTEFDRILGLDKIAVFHINDSKNECGAKKDRHENIGFGKIGFDTLHRLVTLKEFEDVPKILETPYVSLPGDEKNKVAPYKYEIAMLREGHFNPELLKDIVEGK